MIEGKVYFVGAGPGDPELITLKGIRCLEESDVVIYDNLANPKLLKYCKNNAEIVYMGKRKGVHSFDQVEINKFMVKRVDFRQESAKNKNCYWLPLIANSNF